MDFDIIAEQYYEAHPDTNPDEISDEEIEEWYLEGQDDYDPEEPFYSDYDSDLAADRYEDFIMGW